jgi:hypothetical protein
MNNVAKYAVPIILLAVISAIIVPNADVIANWGRQHLEPTIGKGAVVVAVVLVIMVPPSALLGALLGLCTRVLRKRIPKEWQRWI